MLAMCAAGIAIATDRALGKLGSYLGAMREVRTRHACACPSACLPVCNYMNVDMHIYIYIDAFVHPTSPCTHTYIIHEWMHTTYLCMYLCMYALCVCVCVCARARPYACMHIGIHEIVHRFCICICLCVGVYAGGWFVSVSFSLPPPLSWCFCLYVQER